MNRKIVSLILSVILCLGLVVPVCAASEFSPLIRSFRGGNVPEETGFLYDEADLLSVAEEAALTSKLESISSQYNAQVVIATIASLDGGDVDGFVEYLYDTMGFGYGASHDGVLLLVCMNPREYRILSNGYAADAVTSSKIEAIGDAIVPDLSEGEYADAFDEFANQCGYYLNGHLNGFPFDFGGNLMIALIVGIVAGLITVFILKGQLKTVRRQDRANVYVKSGSMQVTVHRDLYLYRNVTCVRKESSGKSSGSSRSSRNVGGGSF